MYLFIKAQAFYGMHLHSLVLYCKIYYPFSKEMFFSDLLVIGGA